MTYETARQKVQTVATQTEDGRNTAVVVGDAMQATLDYANDSQQGLNNQLANKADKADVMAERIRAVTAEGMLAQQISGETQRAKIAEDMLSASIAQGEQLLAGVVKIDGILHAGQAVLREGVYLQYSGTVMSGDTQLDNVLTVSGGQKITQKCNKGRLYAVGADYYRFDGVTCHLIGEGGGDVSCGDVITDITTIL